MNVESVRERVRKINDEIKVGRDEEWAHAEEDRLAQVGAPSDRQRIGRRKSPCGSRDEGGRLRPLVRVMRLRLVKTAGKRWRFGPWPISYGWGFDLGRLRLVYGNRPNLEQEKCRVGHQAMMPDGSWGSLQEAGRAWAKKLTAEGPDGKGPNGAWMWWMSMEDHHPACQHYEWGPCTCSRFYRDKADLRVEAPHTVHGFEG